MKPLAYEQFEELERDHWWFRGRRHVYSQLLRDHLGGRTPERILDIGSGVGGFLAELDALGDELAYTEVDAAALTRCRARGFGSGVRATANALPFRDESFDLICLFDVVEHLQDDRGAIDEVLRVLRPGGTLLISVPAHPWLFSRNDLVAGHHRRYTRASLRQLCRIPGLYLDRCTYTNVALFPSIAAFLLAAKALDKLGFVGGSKERTNLSWRLPRLIDRACYGLFCAELGISRRVDVPLGHSIVAIGRREEYRGRPIVLRPQRPAETRTATRCVSPTA